MKLQRVLESRLEGWRIICSQCNRWHPARKVFANLSRVGDFWCEDCAKGTDTGSVDTRDGWRHETAERETVDAVDSGEVVAVRWDGKQWVEA